MTKQLVYLGVTHKSAPLSVRERIQPDDSQQVAILSALGNLAQEYAILRTCGRFEIYAIAEEPDINKWIRPLAASTGLPRNLLATHLHAKSGDSCADHLLRVAAGLESQVVGEPHILGQVRKAFLSGVETGSMGPLLSALFRNAMHTGKRVRRETAIDAQTHSVATVALEHIERRLGSLRSRSVLVVGAGAMASDVATLLAARKTDRTCIVNRNTERAQRLAERIAGVSLGMDRLPDALAAADATVVCASSPTFLIDKTHLVRLRRCMTLIVDLAMPRNVDPAIASIPGVDLTHMDEFEARRAGQPAVAEAERIVASQLDKFRQWRRGRRVAPLITALLHWANADDPAVARRRKRALHAPIIQLKKGIAA